MKHRWHLLRAAFRKSDLPLLVGALCGVLLFFGMRPQWDPDAGADFQLGEQEALRRASEYVKQLGYSTSGLEPRVVMRRSLPVLYTLQHQLGRVVTIEQAKNPAIHAVMPFFYWEVSWTKKPRISDPDADRTQVRLNLSGVPFYFRNDENQRAVSSAQRQKVLRFLAQQTRMRATDLHQPLALDSAQTAVLLSRTQSGLFYTIADTLSGVRLAQSLQTPAKPILPAGADQPVSVDASGLSALAAQHIQQTVYRRMSWQADSVWTKSGIGYVHFKTDRDLLGLRPSLTVQVDQSGGLVAFQPRFSPIKMSNAPQLTRHGSSMWMLIFGIITASFVLFFIFVFFRRVSVKIVDLQAATRDALVGGGSTMIMILVQLWNQIFSSSLPVQARIALMIGVVLGGAGAGLLVFLISGATDSMFRTRFPEKLRSLTLMRRLFVRNQVVGLALLRGLALAACLQGLHMLQLGLLPHTTLVYTGGGVENTFLSYAMPSVLVFSLFASFFSGVFYLEMFLAGVGSWLMRWNRWSLLFVVLPLIMGAIQLFNVYLYPHAYTFVANAMLGMLLLWGFWRYDLLTVIFAFILFHTAEAVSAGWVAQHSPEWIDAVLFWVFCVGLAGLGVVGIWGGKPENELPDLEPSYILEMASKKRLERELEIAHEVQHSFLPRTMPQLDGLSIAAVCDAAMETGGDYYDVMPLGDHRLGIAIGDVSGKGIQAAFYMTLVKGFLQTLCVEEERPAEVLKRINLHFRRNAQPGIFISMIYGILDVRAQTFTFARAGHNPVILKRSVSQISEAIRPAGLAIGLTDAERFDPLIASETLPLRNGDLLVLYTDGFSEALNTHREIFSDARLAELVGENGKLAPEELIAVIRSEVNRFSEGVGQSDDRTMLVLKMT